MTASLNERKRQILRAVVVNYVKAAEPVGSRTLSRSHLMGLSSATIRNEMADLEEQGYLIQPHTSAGRIPTQKGYRYYVDNLMHLDDLSDDDELILNSTMSTEKMREIEQIINNSARVLSSATNQTSMIMGPQFRKSAFHHLRILPLDEKRGLVVLITDTGFI